MVGFAELTEEEPIMDKLFDFGNRYARESTWKDFALVVLLKRVIVIARFYDVFRQKKNLRFPGVLVDDQRHGGSCSICASLDGRRPPAYRTFHDSGFACARRSSGPVSNGLELRGGAQSR